MEKRHLFERELQQEAVELFAAVGSGGVGAIAPQ